MIMHYSEQISLPLNRLSCLLLTAFQNKSLEFFMLCLTWLLTFLVTNTWSGVTVLSLGCLLVCLNLLWLKSFSYLHCGALLSISLLPLLKHGKVVLFFRCFMALDFSADENQNLPAYGFDRSYKLGICSVADLGCCISLNANWNKQKKRKKCLLL